MLLVVACAAAPGFAQSAGRTTQGDGPQEKEKKTEQEKAQAKAKAKGKGADKPVDETDAAAEALRKLLRLHGEKNPDVVKPPTPATAPSRSPGEAGSAQGKPAQEKPAQGSPPQGKQPQGKQPQEKSPRVRPPQKSPDEDPPQQPKPAAPAGKPTDDTDAAAKALRRLLGGPAADVPEPPDGVRLRPVEPGAGTGSTGDRPSGVGQAVDSVGLVQRGIPIQGQFSLRYRLREGGDDRTQDTRGMLSLAIGDPDRHAVTGHLLARGFLDLDSRRADNQFNGIEQTYGRATGRLYDAYADFHSVDSMDTVRLGRQTIDATPELMFLDGIRLESESMGTYRVRLGGFAGVPVRLFESATGDFATGVHLESRPRRGTRARADFMYVDDARRFGDGQNHLFSFALWQQLTENTSFHGRYSILDGESRDLRLTGTATIPAADLDVELSYYDLLEPQGALANEFDPYFQSAFSYQPYREIRGHVTAPVLATVDLDLGGHVRRLHQDLDEGQFNREFERGFATVIWRDSVARGVNLSVTGEYWNTRGGEDFTTFEFDCTARVTDAVRGSIGTSYALFKYDAFSQIERDRVRTYYAMGEYRMRKDCRLRVNYAFETGPFDDYHTLEAQVLWSF